MTTLTELRTQRAEAEKLFLSTLNAIPHARPGFPDLIEFCAEAQGYHREVCAAYAAELSLISSGKLSNDNEHP